MSNIEFLYIVQCVLKKVMLGQLVNKVKRIDLEREIDIKN